VKNKCVPFFVVYLFCSSCIAEIDHKEAYDQLVIPASENTETVANFKPDIRNPWDHYSELREIITRNKEVILEKLYVVDEVQRSTCEDVFDEIINGQMKVIQPVTILSTNKALENYMNANTVCEDFKVSANVYRTGPNSSKELWSEAPYYIFVTEQQDDRYIGILPSGESSKYVPKTPDIIDFEEASPMILFWSSRFCIQVGAASTYTVKGNEYRVGVIASEKYGLLSHAHTHTHRGGAGTHVHDGGTDEHVHDDGTDDRVHSGSSKPQFNLRVMSTLNEEHVYCVASRMDFSEQGE